VTEHADLELIAAFHEGLLDDPAAERLGRHLAQCGICAERDAAIAQVTTRLATAPVPAMPAELARRLDAALDAEIAATRTGAQTAATTPAARAGGPGTGRDRPPRAGHGSTRPATRGVHERASRPGSRSASRRPGRSRGWMATALRPLAAAAAVVLIGGGGYLLIHSSQSSSSSPSVSTGSTSHNRNAQSGMGPAISNGAGSSGVTVDSPATYESGNLRAQAEAALGKYRYKLAPLHKAGNITAQPFGTTRLSGCVKHFAPGHQRLLVFDQASYNGRRAIVIIAPAASGQHGQVWVVSPDCSASTGSLIAHAILS